MSLCLWAFFSCQRESPIKEVPPADTPPTIVRVAPAASSVTDTPNAQVFFQYSLADKEALLYWKVAEVSPTPTLLAEDSLFPGTFRTRSFIYTIPRYDSLTVITIRAWVYDNKLQVDSTDYKIIVDFVRIPPEEPYSVLTYTGDTIYSLLSTTEKWAFDLLLRTNRTSSDAARDIKEVSNVPGQFSRRLTSPNNGYGKVMVVLNDKFLDWYNLTYTKMDQAYRAGTPVDTTPILNVGDIVLLKMKYKEPNTNDPQYAAIYIRAINDDPASDEDFLVFDYKRTYKRN